MLFGQFPADEPHGIPKDCSSTDRIIPYPEPLPAPCAPDLHMTCDGAPIPEDTLIMPQILDLNPSFHAILGIAEGPAGQAGDPPAKKVLLHAGVAFAPIKFPILVPDPTLTGLVHIKLGSVGGDFSPDSSNITLKNSTRSILPK